MVQRRTRYEIIEDILAEARMGKPRTVIMGRCNLGNAQSNAYTKALVKVGYLYEDINPDYGKGELEDGRKKEDAHIKAIYTTTEAGWHILNALEKSRLGLEELEEFLKY